MEQYRRIVGHSVSPESFLDVPVPPAAAHWPSADEVQDDDSYEEPKPATEAPKPAYEEPKPAYEEPKPAYEAPKPTYEEPKPAYEEPKPAYEKPKPTKKPTYQVVYKTTTAPPPQAPSYSAPSAPSPTSGSNGFGAHSGRRIRFRCSVSG